MLDKELLPGTKQAYARLGRVLILGVGNSGRALVEYLLNVAAEDPARVDAIAVAYGDASEDALVDFRAWSTAHPDLIALSQNVEGEFDLCLASPGISNLSDLYAAGRAASAELIGEVEFAWRESAANSRWAAITGTNGKTTTTALCAHLLQQAGFKANAVGNIGDTCIEAVAAGDTDYYVAEVSSYQLASTVDFRPDVAVLLNITPDHLSWHGTHEAYVEAKYKVLANLAKAPEHDAVAVLDATNDTVRAKVRELKAIPDDERGFAYVPLGAAGGLECDMREVCGSANAAFVRDGRMHVALNGAEYDLLHVNDLLLKGEHNVGNALAAATAALALGASLEAVADGLASFHALEHRIEYAGDVKGVACYNDSKATNVDAVLKALTAFLPTRPYILLGGRDKGTDLSPLIDSCNQNAQAAILYGESLPRFQEAFEKACTIPVHTAAHMEDAFDTALGLAHEGDVVLLSPACASFDEFSCFEERGDTFKRLVADRAARA